MTETAPDTASEAPPPAGQARPAASISQASRPPRAAAMAVANAAPAPDLQSAGFVGERITVDCSDGHLRGKAAMAMVVVLALFAATGIFLF